MMKFAVVCRSARAGNVFCRIDPCRNLRVGKVVLFFLEVAYLIVRPVLVQPSSDIRVRFPCDVPCPTCVLSLRRFDDQMEDNKRSIPCLVDGFKPSQRKVLFSCFKRNLKKEIKVRIYTGSGVVSRAIRLMVMVDGDGGERCIEKFRFRDCRRKVLE